MKVFTKTLAFFASISAIVAPVVAQAAESSPAYGTCPCLIISW